MGNDLLVSYRHISIITVFQNPISLKESMVFNVCIDSTLSKTSSFF
ncbi:hypothetical protein RB653_003237 [Dictyostelium firmibasis]|uniref:Uncharacterized protein n=1 Tax=Dictyostelium firmibasis TaxID=79012 RepID=A0AAN7YQQ5_9MYCE